MAARIEDRVPHCGFARHMHVCCRQVSVMLTCIYKNANKTKQYNLFYIMHLLDAKVMLNVPAMQDVSRIFKKGRISL